MSDEIDNLPEPPSLPDPNEPLPIEFREAVLAFRSVAAPSDRCAVCLLALTARPAMAQLETALLESGARSWKGACVADMLYSVNGVLSALGEPLMNDRQMSRHLEEHVDFGRLQTAVQTTRTLPELARPTTVQGELMVGFDDDSASGQLWGALEDLKTVRDIIRKQFIDSPTHQAYDKEGNPIGQVRISAKEVQAYVQTVKAMRDMVDSLQKIRSGEHALQVAIRAGSDETIAETQVRLDDTLSRMASEMESRGLTGEESAELLRSWLRSEGRDGLVALILDVREIAFRAAARLQGVSADPVRR